MTFAEDIEVEAGGQAIEAVVIGNGGVWVEDREVDASKRGVVLSWAEARPLLDYEYDHGFGGEDCHPIYAWTVDRVLFIHEYDGSTTVYSVPRNPQACEPHF